MKFLHTSDWHLGKKLEGYSRIEEQKLFLQELYNIVDDEKIDIIIISGDIYDTGNPPSVAEELFYEGVTNLTDNKDRLVVIIAGNHDNPDRLNALVPLTLSRGIIIVGYPYDVISKIKYNNYEIMDSGESFFKIKFKGEHINFINMPYPNEERLKTLLKDDNESDLQQSFSTVIKNIFNEKEKIFTEDCINIVTGHFYIVGGEESKSERQVQLGGSYGIHHSALPTSADYIALGHLHRNQLVKNTSNSYYSGSPIQYSLSEKDNVKYVNIVEIKNGTTVKKRELTNYKPIEYWKVDTVEDALKKAEDNKEKNCYVYLHIVTNDVIPASIIKELKKIKKDIISINVSSKDTIDSGEEYIIENEPTILEDFISFYKERNNSEPSEEIIELFSKISGEEYGDE